MFEVCVSMEDLVTWATAGDDTVSQALDLDL